MAEIVNLRQRRKAVAKAAAKVQATANAAKFGRTKAEKARETAEAERAATELSGKQRTPGAAGPEGDNS